MTIVLDPPSLAGDCNPLGIGGGGGGGGVEEFLSEL